MARERKIVRAEKKWEEILFSFFSRPLSIVFVCAPVSERLRLILDILPSITSLEHLTVSVAMETWNSYEKVTIHDSMVRFTIRNGRSSKKRTGRHV